MKLASILVLTLFSAGSALAALSNVTWVSSTGTNNLNCSRTMPCATFAQALAATSPDGVINAIDAAEYGIVTITKNVTIDGRGAGAKIDAAPPYGITINNPGGQVTIRDLTIHVPNTAIGIDITGGDLHLENVAIVGAPFYGVFADGTTNPVHLTTKNLTVTNAGLDAIVISGASGSLRDSVMRGSGGAGIDVQSLAGHAAVALVERCELSYNATGIYANNIEKINSRFGPN
jgi:hypothetical protein